MMYTFKDTVAGSKSGGKSSLLQTLFNGINLDERLTDKTGSFITLTISGRGNMEQRITTIEVPGIHGMLEANNPTWSAREITVKYKLSDQTKEGFRERYNQLNYLMQGSKRKLAFTDEEAFFYATLSANDVPEETANSLLGELVFLCSDPFKYGKTHQTISLKKFTWEEYKDQKWGDLIGN
jgi:predicted phage tail component-like protein